MKFPDFFKINTAAPERSKIDISGDVITTHDFGYLKPIFCHEVIPGDKLNINLQSFARLAPMTFPVLGRCNIINRAFYVRMTDIWLKWESFRTGTVFNFNGQSHVPTSVPYVTNYELVDFFLSNGLLYELPSTSSAVGDVQIHPTAVLTEEKKYNFTYDGRRAYDLLLSLGYAINWTNSMSTDTTKMSLLPLLAYVRTFYDWFTPSRYRNNGNAFSWLFNDTEDLQPRGGITRNDILKLILLPHYGTIHEDYFVNAWQNPNMPNEGAFDTSVYTEFNVPNTLDDIKTYNNAHNISDAPRVNLYDPDTLSQISLDYLRRFTNFFKRRQIAGSRYQDDIYSEFGVKPSKNTKRECTLLGSDITPIQISDVMATATGDSGSGNSSELGGYAGKGIGYGKSNFEVECDDFGFVIVISEIVPANAQYYQGRQRYLQHLGLLDFYRAETDNIGTQPIRNDELFADFNSQNEFGDGQNYGGKPDGTFGYAPTYSEYKLGRDVISGDFRVRHLSTGMKAWHLFRDFKTPCQDAPLALNQAFMTNDPANNGNNYDRIFNYSNLTGNTGTDHFYLMYNINATKFSKLRSITESVETYGSGSPITIHNGGTVLS